MAAPGELVGQVAQALGRPPQPYDYGWHAAANTHPEPRDCGRVFGGGIPADVVAEAGDVHGGPGQRVEVPVGRERREEDPQDRSVAAGGVEAEDGLPVGVAYPGGGEGRVEPCRGEPVGVVL